MPLQAPKQTAEAYSYDDPEARPHESSARAIVELLHDRLRPTSVLDVGCGVGVFLSEFARRGVEDIYGIDGEWVPEGSLLIPREKFAPLPLSEPFRLGRQYDLVLCLEVIEHLPASASDTLLDSLTAHGQTICFSGAVPGQGGYGHVNEQFQEHWIERFTQRGYTAYDALRPALWKHPDVEFFYAQNVLLFSTLELPFPTEFIPSPVHPRLYGQKLDPKNYSLKAMLACAPHYVKRLLRVG